MTATAGDGGGLVALARVNALVPEPGGAASVAVVDRLDADGAKYISDLWRVPHDGGPAERLTRGDARDRAPAFLTDGTLLFLSDRPAPGVTDAKAQVWALPPHGEASPLTDEPHGVADFKVAGATLVVLCELLPGVALADQKKTLADRSKLGPSILKFTAQPVRFWDHWLGPTEPRLVAYDLVDRTTHARRELTSDAGDALREGGWDLSRDGRQVAITWASLNPSDRIHDKALALIATDTGARRLIGVVPGVVHAAPRFSPGGDRLVAQRYQRTRDGYGARPLWRYELSDGAAHELTGAWDRWPGAWGIDLRGQVIVTAEEAGHNRVFQVDLDSGEVHAIGPATGSWSHVALLPECDAIVGVRSDLLSAPEAFYFDLASATLRPLARLSGVTPTPGLTARSISVPVGTNGDRERTMAAFIVEPAVSNGRTLLWIHGGPVYAWMDQWHWRWSAPLMAARGYRVVLPNPAGSTGYGLDWVNDIWGNTWGGCCYEDLMHLVTHLAGIGIKPNDIAVMGGSFGGYMTNWIGGHDDRFRALVTHASLYDMSAFHGVTDVPSWWELMLSGAPWSDADFDRYSPSRFVRNWKTPTLILHGERDYRVPIGESLALFEALQAHGVWSELAVFPDENHWILKPRNTVAWYDTVLEFLERVWASAAPA